MGIVMHAQAVVLKQRCSSEPNHCSELHHFMARNPLADITEDGDLASDSVSWWPRIHQNKLSDHIPEWVSTKAFSRHWTHWWLGRDLRSWINWGWFTIGGYDNDMTWYDHQTFSSYFVISCCKVAVLHCATAWRWMNPLVSAEVQSLWSEPVTEAGVPYGAMLLNLTDLRH